MTESNLDFLGQGDWRKRLHQLKQELRGKPSEHRPAIPEQVKGHGTELKPKRAISARSIARGEERPRDTTVTAPASR